MQNSNIEWTDHTWSPWLGCSKVSPGCKFCYITSTTPFRTRGIKHGDPRQELSEDYWDQPLKWNKQMKCEDCGLVSPRWHKEAFTCECPKCGSGLSNVRPRVFPSLCDWLDDQVPAEWLAEFLKLIADTPNLDWLLLTKRPENWNERICAAANTLYLEEDDALQQDLANWSLGRLTPQNVWIGVSVENQEMAEKRIPELIEIPAKVRFLSCEPLLGPLDLSYWLEDPVLPLVDWVICGGESGTDRNIRAMHPEWARSLRDQCVASNVPFFFKQWGSWQPLSTTDGHQLLPFGEYILPSAAGEGFGFLWSPKEKGKRVLDGREWNQFPEVKE
jgi:protein gp37